MEADSFACVCSQVEPYIDRVFPGISRLLVSPDKPRGDSITGIGSRGGETLSLAKGVRVKWSETGMAMEIDQWMSGIETSMKEALLTSIEGCIRGYGMGNYGDWLVENCGQAVLVVSSLVWSNEVAEILHRMKVLLPSFPCGCAACCLSVGLLISL